jgi:hypothetical protein
MECRFAGETEVLGENLPQRHFCPSQNPTWPDPGLNPGRRRGKPATTLKRLPCCSRHRSDCATGTLWQWKKYPRLVTRPFVDRNGE